jgi:phosphate starvation-inducible PhoH-like protein
MGFLPGNIKEKMYPWTIPIFDIFEEYYSKKDINKLIVDNMIEIAPLGFMQGRTFKNSIIIADEMQNSTPNQMLMLTTRIGENSKLVITGDLEQYDRINELNGLEDFLSKFRGRRSSSISNFEFQRSDILRENVVKEVLDIYGGDIPINFLTKEDIEEEMKYDNIEEFENNEI